MPSESSPYFIGVAGESGVGKTTIAGSMSFFYGEENTLVVSTDDLHKWERTSPMWSHLTHSNPDANNLEMGDLQIEALSRGEPIYRSSYNHDNGHFTPPRKLFPKPYVINEGLHAFFSDKANAAMGLRVYVDTEDSLRVEWKMLRDTRCRGYSRKEAEEMIARRRADDSLIRSVQLPRSDVVIGLSVGSDGKLAISMRFQGSSAGQRAMLDFVAESLIGKPGPLLAYEQGGKT